MNKKDIKKWAKMPEMINHDSSEYDEFHEIVRDPESIEQLLTYAVYMEGKVNADKAENMGGSFGRPSYLDSWKEAQELLFRWKWRWLLLTVLLCVFSALLTYKIFI